MLLQCSCCCRPCSAVLCCYTVADAVGYFMLMVPLPRRSSELLLRRLFAFFRYCIAAVAVELKRMLVLPRRSNVPPAAVPLQFVF